jgi:hypothetical protein
MNRTSRFSGAERKLRMAHAGTVWAAATLLLVGVTAHFAQADPGVGCPRSTSCQRWCPGDPDPAGRPVPWDTGVCHDYYWDYKGVHDVGTGQFYAWNSMPFKQPPPAGPVPTETSYLPLPTLPFCPVPPWCP